MKFRCVIFDLDGTLADTLGGIALSMNSALRFYGFPALPERSYAALVGRGIERLAADCLPEEARGGENAALVARKAGEYYAEDPLAGSKPYPGIPELLGGLERLKVKRAVLSNKPDRIARLVVKGLFPPDSFEAVQGEIPGVARKPDPGAAWEIMVGLGVTPRETIFAGDSEIDMRTAVASEASPLGVSWGYRSRETLAGAGATRIIDHPAELLEIIRETRR